MDKSLLIKRSARSLFIIGLSFWVGSIFFFSTIVAQTIFATLPVEQAGKLISVIFDNYYPMQYILSAILVFTGLYLYYSEGSPYNSIWIKRLILTVIMLIITLYSGLYVRGNAREAKRIMNSTDINSEIHIVANKEFRSSHRNSVVANGLVFLLGIVMLIHVSYKHNE